jgi:hypothetical protein
MKTADEQRAALMRIVDLAITEVAISIVPDLDPGDAK